MKQNEKEQLRQYAYHLKEMMKTDGWKIFHTHWEFMMRSVLGGEINGQWISGKLRGSNIAANEIQYYIGYRDALMELYDSIQSTIKDAERLNGE